MYIVTNVNIFGIRYSKVSIKNAPEGGKLLMVAENRPEKFVQVHEFLRREAPVDSPVVCTIPPGLVEEDGFPIGFLYASNSEFEAWLKQNVYEDKPDNGPLTD